MCTHAPEKIPSKHLFLKTPRKRGSERFFFSRSQFYYIFYLSFSPTLVFSVFFLFFYDKLSSNSFSNRI